MFIIYNMSYFSYEYQSQKDCDENCLESPFGSIESVKAVSDLYSPITGIISKLNDDLKTNPEIVSQSPYDKGWMLEVVPSSLETESKSLLTPQSYADLIKDLTKK